MTRGMNGALSAPIGLVVGGVIGWMVGCASAQAAEGGSPAAPVPAAVAVQGAGLAGNLELAALKDADQADRTPTGFQGDPGDINARDEARRRRVAALLDAGLVRTAEDHYNAALIYQHGATVEDLRLAHALATIAARMAPSSRGSRWLAAASWDRLMMRLGQPQWYGTQFVKDKDSGRWVLYRIDESLVTDEQRAEWQVPPLAANRQRAEAMNGASGR